MLTFRDIDTNGRHDVECLVRWANDRSIRHLYQRFSNRQQYERSLQIDYAHEKLRESVSTGRTVHMIEWDGQTVGEVSLEMDSPALLAPKPKTGWVGIILGEARGRGRGIGRRAMTHIEEVALALGAEQIQIGVFEFNTRAQRLYASMGYHPILETRDFTWWNDKMWTDFRLEKPLQCL